MGSKAQLAELSVELSANTASFKKGMEQANKSMNRMEKHAKKSRSSIKRMESGLASAAKGFLVLGAAAGAAFSIGALKNIIDVNSALAKSADAVGIGIEAYQSYQYAAELAGISTSQFASNMTAFVKRVGEARVGMGPLVSGLKNLDASLLKNITSAKGQEEAFKVLADGVMNASSATEAAAIANAAFGRSGVNMVNMLRNGAEGLSAMEKEARALGIIMEEDLVRAAEKYDDALLRLSKQAKKTFGTALLGTLKATMDNANKVMYFFFGSVEKGWLQIKYAFEATWLTISEGFAAGTRQMAIDFALFISEIGAKMTGIIPDDYNPFAKMATSLRELSDAPSGFTQSMADLNNSLEEGKQIIDDRVTDLFVMENAEQAASAAAAEHSRNLKEQYNNYQQMGDVDAGKKIKADLDEATKAMKSFEKSILSTQQGSDLLLEKMSLLDDMLIAGKIDTETYNNALTEFSQTMSTQGVESAQLMTQSLEEMAQSGIGQMVDGFLSGTQSFADLANTFLRGIAEMIVKQLIFNAISRAMSAAFGGFSGGGTMPAPPGLAMAIPGGGSTGGISLFGSSMDSGGLPGYSRSSGSNRPVVNNNISVINNSKADVQTQESTDSGGNTNIEILVSDMVKGEMKKGGFDNVNRNMYGLSRRGF